VKASYVPGVPKQLSVYMLNYLLVNGPFLWGHPVSVKKIFCHIEKSYCFYKDHVVSSFMGVLDFGINTCTSHTPHSDFSIKSALTKSLSY